MKIVLTTLKKILFWSYERGSWQYDIMCVLILAFIFFGPNDVFHNHRSSTADEVAGWPIFVSREQVEGPAPGRLEEAISQRLSEKYGHKVIVSRIDQVRDNAGQLTGYLAWEE
ncbi:MAG TPA: hypothetical protein VF747_09970 [Blastocatellia bacterium]|jgi:hypothetical protein